MGDRERVQFYKYPNMINGFMYDKSINLLLNYSEESNIDINDAIELFNAIRNVKTFYDQNVLDKSLDTKGIKAVISKVRKRIGIYISDLIKSNSLSDSYKNVLSMFKGDYWSFLNDYNAYKSISNDLFKSHFAFDYSLQMLLIHKNIVDKYDLIIKEQMFLNVREAVEILIEKFFAIDETKMYYLPKSLQVADIEKIFEEYVLSDDENPHLLKLIESLPSDPHCHILDETRIKAKAKRIAINEAFFSQNKGVKITADFIVCFLESVPESVGVKKTKEKTNEKIEISKDWISNNLDSPTLMNNFIYLLNIVDQEMRISNTFKSSQVGAFDVLFGFYNHYKNLYPSSMSFAFDKIRSPIAVQAYCQYLVKTHDIRIEQIIEWFYKEYLLEEFKIKDFFCFMPTENSSNLEKCRTICCEIESIIKQYSSYVKYGYIDHDLIESFSTPVNFSDIPSLVIGKNVYLTEEGMIVAKLLFAEPTLSFISGKKELNYDSFYDLINENKVKLNDFNDFQTKQLEYLLEREIVGADKDGYLLFKNKLGVVVLKDIFTNEFGSNLFYQRLNIKACIQKLSQKNYIHFDSFFLSENESNYFNYVLNKKAFSNGYDLRNKYLHGTQPKRGTDENLHLSNYYILLTLLIIITIKINDELCAKFEAIEPAVQS